MELTDLVRHLGLFTKLSEVLACRLNEKNYLHSGAKIAFYCSRERKLLGYFTKDKNSYF